MPLPRSNDIEDMLRDIHDANREQVARAGSGHAKADDHADR
jgi:hypothetical protein